MAGLGTAAYLAFQARNTEGGELESGRHRRRGDLTWDTRGPPPDPGFLYSRAPRARASQALNPERGRQRKKARPMVGRLFGERFSEHAKERLLAPGGAGRPYQQSHRPGSAEKPRSRSRLRAWRTSSQDSVPRCGLRCRGELACLDAGLRSLSGAREPGLCCFLGRVAPWGAAIRRLLGGGGRFGLQLSSGISGGLRPACGSPSGAPSPDSCLPGLRGGPRDPGVGLVDRSGSVWSPRLALTGFPIGSLLQGFSSWTLCL